MIETQVRPGAYYDSIVLMQLQRALVALPEIEDAGVVMGTLANQDVLAQSGLLDGHGRAAHPEDLIIAIRASSPAAAAAALAQVDALLARRKTQADLTFRPKSLAAAARLLPAAQWVLISTPGRYAAGVARDALALGKHVFLYSDNVSVDDEIRLKQAAAAKGLLVMGPDCGTAIIGGVGLGFANQVRRGAIGLVAASGTGLQLVSARIHQLGAGVSHAVGVGGRDLTEAVGAVSARQALNLLARDPATQVIVLISKPPAPAVAAELVRAAQATGKPVVIDFIGHSATPTPAPQIYFANTLDRAAELAVALAGAQPTAKPRPISDEPAFAPGQRYLRGVFSGGTLAYEAQFILQEYALDVYANIPLDKRWQLPKATASRQHTIVDLGEDEFTVGRLHPMLDNDLRIKRILQEAADPETAVLLVDVVLGHGAHPDPASELAPALAQAQQLAATQGRTLLVLAVVVGTDADPQGLDRQIELLTAAGVQVETANEPAVRRAAAIAQRLNPVAGFPPVDLAAFHAPLAALNVGLDTFAASLTAQQAPVVQVDWRPPAGGNEQLMGILERMKPRTV